MVMPTKQIFISAVKPWRLTFFLHMKHVLLQCMWMFLVWVGNDRQSRIVLLYILLLFHIFSGEIQLILSCFTLSAQMCISFTPKIWHLKFYSHIYHIVRVLQKKGTWNWLDLGFYCLFHLFVALNQLSSHLTFLSFNKMAVVIDISQSNVKFK